MTLIVTADGAKARGSKDSNAKSEKAALLITANGEHHKVIIHELRVLFQMS